MGKFRPLADRRDLGWTVAAPILKPVLLALTRRDWRCGEHIPAHGGAIIALNHLSHVDPITTSHLIWDYGRIPRFLAKQSLFDMEGVIGWWFQHSGLVPVDRAAGASGMSAAIDAVDRGELIVVYVEGSITKDPDGWPMVPKTGAARIALATGAPVIPIGQWGAQQLLPAYTKRLNLSGRSTIHLNVGEPVPLEDLRALETTTEVVHRATDRIMERIVSLVEELREERAPAERFDPAKR